MAQDRSNRLRVLMVSSDYPPDIGGIAAHVEALSRFLVARGIEVAVASVWHEFSRAAARAASPVPMRRPAGWVRLGPLRFSIHRRVLRRCVRACLREQPADVLHIHGHAWEAYATRPWAGRFPIVGTMHSSGFLAKARTERGRARLRSALRHVTAFTAPSRELCDAVDRLGIAAGPCAYIPNGVDPVQFQPSSGSHPASVPFDLPAGHPIVLCPRRLVPKNGVLDLARAVPAILRKHPDAVFVFAGSEDPACAEEARSALRAAGVLHACRFLGPVPHDRMPDLLRAATVCVLPSHVEATSLAGLEAMACGVPLVGTRVGGIPEIIVDGETGLLVPPSSPEDLAGAVARLLADSNLARRLAKAARDRVVAAFSWDRIAEQFLDVYRRAVSIGGDSIR